ncbi:Major facilitator-type transporter [Lachnellula willkommii]|uniref:Major facilitator-type transporter n=1 Tax=Lachnellula willkommii TaxID=215461 RepID=A0A559MB94_9HELO|nr:Major facilitator-type transporter [Lachnellula willkommii]
MAIIEHPASKANEVTPLLSRGPVIEAPKYGKSVLYRALLCGFLVSLSFGVTQVPLIYVFRLMTCEVYYQTHPEPGPGSKRCSVREIEAGTSRAIALLSASTTICGVLNLLITGWTIKKFGIKTGLLLSVFWPAARLAVQNIGVMVGGGNGIIIIQVSQIITVLGGPSGYLLALNSYVTEILEPSERTGALGKLQGYCFLGMSSAYLIGGTISDAFGIIAPFRVTLVSFLGSCVYVLLALPRIPPTKEVASQATTGFAKFFGPLKMFTPQRWILLGGRIETQYGMILLAIGVFMGVLATGYIPTLLQMYATDIYDFGTSENGYLISLNSFIRGLFLTLAFPKVISAGRKWFAGSTLSKPTDTAPPKDSPIPDVTHQQNDLAALEAMNDEEEPVEPPELVGERETFAFDLVYTRYSLLADGVLTGAAAFVSQGWQMYLVAALLPLAAGTGSSAKGTILQMCSATERADALSAITLIEMIARLTTTSVFGLVFAAFAEIGKTYLVFICNAAVALLGFCVLLFSRFPPDGSRRFEEGEDVEDAGTA